MIKSNNINGRVYIINKQRNRIKIFKPFEDISKPSPSINAMEISYGCLYKRSSKPVMKGSRVESTEDPRKEYKKLFKQGWSKKSMKNSIFKSYLKKNKGSFYSLKLLAVFLNKLFGIFY